MTTHRLAFATLLVATVACHACGPGDAPDESASDASETDTLSLLRKLAPLEARTAVGSGDPRSSGYWVMWSTCGEGSQAEAARNSGGREAGWLLVDDVLQDPGVVLGDWPVTTCADAVAVLEVDDEDAVAGLARQLLTAQLNLAARSETCRAAGDMMVAAGELLVNQGYGGPAAETQLPDAGTAESIGQIAYLLRLYNGGQLCR